LVSLKEVFCERSDQGRGIRLSKAKGWDEKYWGARKEV
jgi:hypothetical protein